MKALGATFFAVVDHFGTEAGVVIVDGPNYSDGVCLKRAKQKKMTLIISIFWQNVFEFYFVLLTFYSYYFKLRRTQYYVV